ncbi:hypothetical protein [Streptomyces sp. BPTC-684]|uniref:hypothetical protein n=1 Tax=Streptomyces sp. BPTC-684 TaxID=3043734 RepID=UPI0024B04208|nr:hypothetical protein [Streptomyces sp. BPTC-684]WHM41262.1 hypothetical protein QIY60_09180 [Streptomyces sp. BPTC-684]
MALGLLAAPAAHAGGPTSVLIVSPESAQTAARYNSDADYSALMTLLGRPNQGQKERPPSLDAAMRSRQINVTWMVHDMAPWRLDRVFTSDDTTTVWIHTAADVPRTFNGYWHRAQRPAELRALLKKLGVMGPVTGSGSTGVAPQEWTTPPVEPEQGQGREETATITAGKNVSTDSTATGWWWALPGLTIGAALALLIRPWATRLPATVATSWRGRDDGPRQELRDVDGA